MSVLRGHMSEPLNEVENLKKIGLTVQVGSKRDAMDIIPDPMDSEFIFGIGTAGLTPFEFELVGKHEGDEIILHVDKSQIHGSFQHIQFPLPALSPEHNDLYFKFKIKSISQPENSEVISAMAAGTDCGDGCCGCH